MEAQCEQIGRWRGWGGRRGGGGGTMQACLFQIKASSARFTLRVFLIVAVSSARRVM